MKKTIEEPEVVSYEKDELIVETAFTSPIESEVTHDLE